MSVDNEDVPSEADASFSNNKEDQGAEKVLNIKNKGSSEKQNESIDAKADQTEGDSNASNVDAKDKVFLSKGLDKKVFNFLLGKLI